jgi:DNA helicase-2/ATP-dependent DNA helicase PcrA
MEGFDEPRVVYDDLAEDDPWKIGMKIKHPSFGIGVIKAREGIGEGAKLTVIFPGAGQKKLMVKYASIIEA